MIQKKIEDQLAEEILTNAYQPGDTILLKLVDDKIVFERKEGANVAIVPVFIKAGTTDSEFVNGLNIGDKIVVSGSDLSIGNHINSPYNKITPDNIVRVCQNAGKEFYQSTLDLHTPICLVEFKLVPIGAIKSKLDKTKNSFVNPFVHKVFTNGGEA